MAKRQDKDLLKTLRSGGVRKSVARFLAESTGRGKPPTRAARTVGSLKAAVGELESRVLGSQRSEAAKKAARTRKRKADKRGAAARKAARTRAKTRG
jgi:hypothetical protein